MAVNSVSRMVFSIQADRQTKIRRICYLWLDFVSYLDTNPTDILHLPQTRQYEC